MLYSEVEALNFKAPSCKPTCWLTFAHKPLLGRMISVDREVLMSQVVFECFDTTDDSQTFQLRCIPILLFVEFPIVNCEPP